MNIKSPIFTRGFAARENTDFVVHSVNANSKDPNQELSSAASTLGLYYFPKFLLLAKYWVNKSRSLHIFPTIYKDVFVLPGESQQCIFASCQQLTGLTYPKLETDLFIYGHRYEMCPQGRNLFG